MSRPPDERLRDGHTRDVLDRRLGSLCQSALGSTPETHPRAAINSSVLGLIVMIPSWLVGVRTAVLGGHGVASVYLLRALEGGCPGGC
jgi:hypothetical protein